VVGLLPFMELRLHLHQVTELLVVELEVVVFLLRVTELLAVGSVEVPLHRVTELQLVGEEAVVDLLHRVTVLLQLLRRVMVLLQPLHLGMEPQMVEMLAAVVFLPELEVSEHHLLAMAPQQHRPKATEHHQADHPLHPEVMVPLNLRPLHLPPTEHPQYRHQTMEPPVSPLDLSVGEHHLKVMKPLLTHQHQHVVTRPPQDLHQVTGHLLHPVTLVDTHHKTMSPLGALDPLEVAHHPRVTEHLPDHLTAMVLPVFRLARRLKAMVPLQGQLARTVLLQLLHQVTEHQLLHLAPSELRLKTMALLLDLLEVMVPLQLRHPRIMERQRVDHQDQ